MDSRTQPLSTIWSDLTSLDTSAGTLHFILAEVVGPVVVFIAIWLAGWLLRRITIRAMERARADAQVRTLMTNVITAATIVLALFGALTNGGLNISVLLTFGGLFSLAVGFAFQDLLRNILAGIFLLLERPFRIGDLITVGDQAGMVQNIRLRTTELKTVDGRKVVLPNLAAFTGPVINSSAFKLRRFELRLWVPAGADIDRAVRTTRREISATRELLTDPPTLIIPQVDFDNGHTVLRLDYWLDYRRHDPDSVAADLARRLRVSVGATVEQAAVQPDA